MSKKLKTYGNRLDSGVDHVRKITKDFCSALDLTLFGYVRVYNDGRLGWVTSDADQDRLLIESGSMQDDPLLDTSTGLKSGRYLWFHDRKFPGSAAFYRDRAKLFGVDHGMVVVRHQKEYLETCCFSGSLLKKSLCNGFLNEVPLFDAFMDHFTSQLNRPLLQLLEDGVLISEVKQEYGRHQAEDSHFELLALCGWKDVLKLSQRERECLKKLSRGISYKEIARELKISSRTVEHYLESVKNKLGLNSRAELLALAHKIGGLLP